MPELSLTQLRDLATRTNSELFVGKRDGNADDRVYTQEGSLGGRLVRNLKVGLGTEDRTARQAEYGDAKDVVQRAMIDAFGEEIGTKAFQAGIGKVDAEGNWSSDKNYPITGRHIEKMLSTAQNLVGGHRDIANWMERVRGEPNSEAMHVTLGEKISQPTGRVQRDDAFKSLQDDLLEDARYLPANKQHSFWMVDVGLKGGRHETIALAIDKENPDHIKTLDREGKTQLVPRDEIGAYLASETSRWSSFGVASLSLHRAEETPAMLLEINRGEQGVPKFDIEHECDFQLQDGRRAANARPLIDNMTWNNAIVGGSPSLIANEDRTGNTAFQRRVEDGSLRVSIDGDVPRQIEGADSLIAVNVPGDRAMIFLNEDERAGLARFIGGIPMDMTFGAIVGNEDVIPLAIDVTVNARHTDDGSVEFDLEFRSPLPEGVKLRSGADVVDGQDCDLLLTMHLPRDQLTAERPRFKLDNPQIEMRPRDDSSDSGNLPRSSRPTHIGMDEIDKWMNTMIDRNDDQVGTVRLGEKVSNPLGSVSLDRACRGLQADLIADRQNQLIVDDHSVWIVDVETKSGQSAAIGLHVDENDPTNVEILHPEGSSSRVPLNELGANLKKITEDWDVQSLSLHRAQTGIGGDDSEVDSNQDDQDVNDKGGIRSVYEDDDSLTLDGPGIQRINVDGKTMIMIGPDKDDVPEPIARDLPELDFQVEGEGLSANVRHLISDEDWNDIKGRNMSSLEVERDRLEQGHDMGGTYQQRLIDYSINVKLEGDEMLPITSNRSPLEQLSDLRLQGQAVGLGSGQRENLTRFVGGNLLDQVYRDITGEGRYGAKPEHIEVTLKPQYREGVGCDFDITFRTRLPEGVTVPFEGEKGSGDNFDLVVSMHVPHEEITKRSPNIQVGDPKIEARME